ncbi:MAG: FAD-dependent oxidoreductase [Bacillota bacterium]|nr:FAD-dependent oxidoreductase [Bacillota bacterium]
MNLNSQFSFYPPQPDNPDDAVRHMLTLYALSQKGWPGDFGIIMKLMAPPPPITTYVRPGEFKGIKVGVIGGGLAGLSAAYELRKAGFDITVFDALEDRVGGRIYTCYFDEGKKFYNEFGPMRIPVSHETVWHYIKLFNLPTRPFIQVDANAYVYLKKIRVRNDLQGINVMKYIYPKYALTNKERHINWQGLLFKGTDNHLLNATLEDRSEIIRVLQYYRDRTVFWSSNSNINMMEAAGLSQEAINLVSNFNPLLYGGLYNSFIDFIEEDYTANLAFLYEIPGGMQKLPLAFYKTFLLRQPYESIPAEYTGSVFYKAGCWINEINFDLLSNKIKLRYRNPRTKKSAEEIFDYVICAIPFSTLRNIHVDPLFSNIKMRAIREVNYIPAQKSLLMCSERFWEKEGIAGGGSFTDLPIASVWYPSDHAKLINDPLNPLSQFGNLPWNEPGVFIGSFNFNLDTTRLTNQPQELYFEEIKREVEMVHGLQPGYLDNIVVGHKTVNWDEQPTIRGAISFFTPQQKILFSYGMAQPEYNGRMFFAGEHISAVHRWMQGALQSGMQAANNLALACKYNFK